MQQAVSPTRVCILIGIAFLEGNLAAQIKRLNAYIQQFYFWRFPDRHLFKRRKTFFVEQFHHIVIWNTLNVYQ